MADERSSSPPKRRTAARGINYNEKEADTKLANRIEKLERAGAVGKIIKSRRGRGGGIIMNCSANVGDKIKYQKFLGDKSIEWNFIPSVPTFFRKANRFSTILDLEDAYVDIEVQCLHGADSVLMKANDTIYMVSEPPGEPYYIGRVVEFKAKPEFRVMISQASKDLKKFPVKFFQVKMNWFYRSRDIQNRHINVQPRLLYASLHEDVCPIESYRGHCLVIHENEITNIAIDKIDFVTKPNNFYFNQLFDRYTSKYYEVAITSDLLKLQTSSPFLQILNARFRYVFVEEGFPLKEIIRKRILTGYEDPHADGQFWNDCCSVCREWCNKSTCLECEECKQTVHLYCLEPPLDRKPNKDIVWFCFRCLKKQEDSEAANQELEEDQLEEEQYMNSFKQELNDAARRSLRENNFSKKYYLWFQYAGQNMLNHLKDLMCQDLVLPYPMKLSRIGYRYQWSGCCNGKGFTSKSRLSDFEQERGTDRTSRLLWSMKNSNIDPNKVDRYVEECKAKYPPKLGMLPESCNFLDLVVKTLMVNDFDVDLAIKECGRLASRESLQEPTFTSEELKRFEDAIAEYGSELLPVSRCVNSQPTSMIVRYYYQWKKTPNGRRIWGNFKGRKKNIGKEQAKIENFDYKLTEDRKSNRERKPTKLALESTLKYIDDSSFEIENGPLLKPYFKCMFCEVDYSPMWYKVTGGSDDDYVKKRMQTGVSEKTGTRVNSLVAKVPRTKNNEKKGKTLEALCIRCARIWRRYGVEWQHPLTVLRRLNGKSIGSLYATLELVFSESNINTLQLSPQQAYNKCLEWELVQDSELITKQRKDMIKLPDRLAKLKKSLMSVRVQLCKMVKRPLDKISWNKDRMVLDLQEYLRQGRKKKQKGVQTARDNIDNAKKVVKQSRHQTNGNIKDRIDEKLELRMQKLLDLTIDLKGNLSSSGDLQVDLPLRGSRLGKLSIDPDTKYLQLDEGVYEELNSLLLRPSKKDNSAGLPHIQLPSERSNSDAEFPSCEYFCATNTRDVPLITDERDTAQLLNMYHRLDPFHSNSNHEHDNGMRCSVPIRKLVSMEADSFESRFKKPKVFCNVCRELFDRNFDEEINCRGCGLSVHYHCYGITLSTDLLRKKTKSYDWYCDPCSNQIRPIVSTNYKCDLCYIKRLEDNVSRGHLDNEDPGALKCTTSGSWCHIICAVFNPNIKFGCSDKLQPIINVNHVIAKNLGQFCDICKLEGGGLIKCSLCTTKFHATCATVTPGFSLKMKMNKNINALQCNKPMCEVDGEGYFLTPVAFCGKHQDEFHEVGNFYPLSWKRDGKSKSLLQLYCKNYKENARMSTVFARYLEQQNIWKENIFEHLNQLEEGEMVCDSSKVSSRNKLAESETRTCSTCGTSKSIFWYDRNICHTCHISLDTDIHDSRVETPAQIPDLIYPSANEADAARAFMQVEADVSEAGKIMHLGNNCRKST